MKVKALDKRQV